MDTSLIMCPGCRKLVFDWASKCPYCGFLYPGLHPAEPIPTKIGDVSPDFASGVLRIIFGLLLFPVCFVLVFLSPIYGMCSVGVPIYFLSRGVVKIGHCLPVCCPYCGTECYTGRFFKDYQCPVCKKRSVRQGDYLNPL